MVSLKDLEQVGDAIGGDALTPNPQTPGGPSDLVFTRTFKVIGQNNVTQVKATDYLFQILNPPIRVVDYQYTDAYLTKQQLKRIDAINYHLICVFSQIPSPWITDSHYDNVTFAGVLPSSLYRWSEFEFRSGPSSFSTQIRFEHRYFLGPVSSIPTYQRFKPVDPISGLRVSTISDYTSPSADQYIAMVNGRQEIIVESVVLPFRGDIWDLRTKYALAK